MAAAAADGALARRRLRGTLAAIRRLLLIAWCRALLAFPVAVLAFGEAMMTRATATLTPMQLAAPEGVRGWVSSLFSTVIRVGAGIGAVAVGLAAVGAGLPAATAVAAILCAVILGLLRRRASSNDHSAGA